MGDYSAKPLAESSLVAYWRLNETSGTSVADSKGTNTGTLSGTYTLNQTSLVPGDADPCISFDGSTGLVTVPDATALDLSTAFTVEAWIYPTSIPSSGVFRGICDKGTSIVSYYMQFNGPTLEFGFNDSIGNRYRCQNPNSMSVNTAYHIAGTFDGSNLRLYVNGTLVQTLAGPSAAVTNTEVFTIGRFSSGEFFQGSIDEVALYNTALSGAVIADHAIGAGSIQTVTPDADNSTGSWTATPLWSKVGDSSDATVITDTASGGIAGSSATSDLDPNASVSNAWTANGTFPTNLADGVRSPTAPSTGSNYITTSTSASVAEMDCGTFTLPAGATVISATAFVYGSGGTKRRIDIVLETGATSLATAQIAAGAAAAWNSGAVYSGSLTQAQIDALRIKLTCNQTGGGGASAVFVYAAYVEVAYTTAATPGATSTAKLSLAGATTPDTQTSHNIKIRGRVTTAATATFRATLYQGATAIGPELESSALSTTLATYTLAIANSDAATITDYSNLEIDLRGYNSDGTNPMFEVAEAWLEIPAGSAPSGTTNPLTLSVTVTAGPASGGGGGLLTGTSVLTSTSLLTSAGGAGGGFIRVVGKPMAASSATATSISRRAVKVVAATLTGVLALVRRVTKGQSAATTLAVALVASPLHMKTLAATVAGVASRSNVVRFAKTVVMSPTASLSRRAQKVASATSNAATSVRCATSAVRSASAAQVASLATAAVHVYQVALTAVTSGVASATRRASLLRTVASSTALTLARRVALPRQITTSGVVGLIRQVRLVRSSLITDAATLAATKLSTTVHLTLTAVVASAGVLRRSVFLSKAATPATTTALSRAIATTRAVATTPVVAALKVFRSVWSASTTLVVSLAADFLTGTIFLTLTAVSATSASVQRASAKVVAITSSLSTSAAKFMPRSFAVGSSPLAAVAKSKGIVVAVTVASVASLARRINAVRAAGVPTTTSVGRGLSKGLSAAVGTSPVAVRAVSLIRAVAVAGTVSTAAERATNTIQLALTVVTGAVPALSRSIALVRVAAPAAVPTFSRYLAKSFVASSPSASLVEKSVQQTWQVTTSFVASVARLFVSAIVRLNDTTLYTVITTVWSAVQSLSTTIQSRVTNTVLATDAGSIISEDTDLTVVPVVAQEWVSGEEARVEGAGTGYHIRAVPLDPTSTTLYVMQD